ncbi:LysE family translocator [Roseobacter weihaiensis]|uniref:LysE family translocator n=1 Tax=Roseobacter weihaiensis TaxID=2763262 RepID=UPI001D0AC920|nr:LysE family translocator [Roseobacter sp. H9]
MTDPDTLIPLSAILIGWMLAAGSPGPATLAISGTSMQQGRLAGLTVALGILFGSASWGIAAGLGFSAVMMANVWLFELLRYLGAAYLMFLALKSLRAAWRGGAVTAVETPRRRLFAKGALIHLTNPKAILSWGAIYAIALPAGSGPAAVWTLFGWLFCGSIVIFLGYAVLFSAPPVARGYVRAKRAFDASFGLLFGFASLKILTARLA